MKKILLIIEREYTTMVMRKAFILSTLLMPLLVVVVGALPIVINELSSDSTTSRQTVAVIDETGKMQGVIRPNALFDIMPLKGDPGKTDAAQFLRQAGESLDAVVLIPADVLTAKQVTIYSEKTLDVSLTNYISTSLTDTISAINMAALGVTSQQLHDATADVDVRGVKLDSSGAGSDSSSEMAMVIGMVLAMVIYGFVLSYGAIIMSSVVDEKSNRIVEVIVSSCKPFELMMGKIVGVGLVGLTQFAIWAVLISMGGGLITLFLPSAELLNEAGEAAQGAAVTVDVLAAITSINLPLMLVCFVLYFVGGYLLFGSLFAGLGSAVNEPNETSMLMMPMMIIEIVALYVGIGCMENPNSVMAVWCSIIPFTSPIVMMIRLPYDVPLWQIALSFVLLYATALGCVWVAGRIYRQGILRYGKKVTWSDIFRFVRKSE